MISALEDLTRIFNKKAEEFKDAIKIGRTQLMDALPVTLGIEFGTYAYSLGIAGKELFQAPHNLTYVGLGGTAVGTGADSPKGFSKVAIQHLAEISRLDLRPSSNVFYCLQSKFDIANCSSALRNLSLELIKIANDLWLMASGPSAGLAEIFIPPVHEGFSIMPGKVNPSLAECLNMICFQVVGNDVSVAMAAQAGPKFTKNMVEGLAVNKQRIDSYVEESSSCHFTYSVHMVHEGRKHGDECSGHRFTQGLDVKGAA